MMEQNYYISRYCLIRDRKIRLNEAVVFTGDESEPAPFFTEAYKFLNVNYPKFYKMDNLCKLGFIGTELLLRGTPINEKYEPAETGIVLYNASSSADTDRNHQDSIQDRDAYFPSPSVFVYTLPNIVIGEICIRNKFFGESAFFITHNFEARAMCDYVRQLLDQNYMQCCITGWVEMEGDHYDAALYLIEKSDTKTAGIAIFEPEIVSNLYLQGI